MLAKTIGKVLAYTLAVVLVVGVFSYTPLSAATPAQAAEGDATGGFGNDSPSLGISGGTGGGNLVISNVVSGCAGGCDVTQQAIGGGVQAADPYTKSFVLACLGGRDVCNVSFTPSYGMWKTEQCGYRLYYGGSVLATSPDMAVSILKVMLIGGDRGARSIFTAITGYGNYAADEAAGNLIGSISAQSARNLPAKDADFRGGSFRFTCYTHLSDLQASWNGTESASCPPRNDGRPYPWSVGYLYTVTDEKRGETVTADNGESFVNESWTKVGGGCLYVNRDQKPTIDRGLTQVVTCYWNHSYSGAFSTNRNAIIGGGQATRNAPVPAGPDPSRQPSVRGTLTNGELVNCSTDINWNANLSLDDGYAYYRLSAHYNYQRFYLHYFSANWTNAGTLAEIVPGNINNGTSSRYGTFSCSLNPTFTQHASAGEMPTNVTFKYSECPQTRPLWQCVPDNIPMVNGTTNNVSLMRDGSYVPTKLPLVTVTGSAVRDVGGAGVRDASNPASQIAGNNMSYVVNVKPNSSPLRGTVASANDERQYFRMYSTDPTTGAATTRDMWGARTLNPNANQHKFMTYYWSSDNGRVWGMDYTTQIDRAEFLVPYVDSHNWNGGGSNIGVGSRWMLDTVIPCGPTLDSNKADIVRSVLD